MKTSRPDYDFLSCLMFVAVLTGRARQVRDDLGGMTYAACEDNPHPHDVRRCPNCGCAAVAADRAAETWRAGPLSIRRWLYCSACGLKGPDCYGHPALVENRWNEMCERIRAVQP